MHPQFVMIYSGKLTIIEKNLNETEPSNVKLNILNRYGDMITLLDVKNFLIWVIKDAIHILFPCLKY